MMYSEVKQQLKQLGQQFDPPAVEQVIGEIVRLRSLALHAATSDLEPQQIKVGRQNADELDDLLIEALMYLPENRERFPVFITHPNGRQFILTSVNGDNAHYVPSDEWDGAFTYKPIERSERLKSERSTSRQVLEVIIALEKANKNPVEAGDLSEVTALVLNSLRLGTE